jgi:hypothetical protein
MRQRAALFAYAILFAPACVRYSTVVAQPTALERQLLGEYEKLDDELVWASSVRSGGEPDLYAFEVIKAHALEQRSIQRFNEDDLAELKGRGCIAERLDAHIVSRPCDLGESDPAAVRRITRIVAEENRARDVIMLWAAHELARKEGKAAPDKGQVEELKRTYSRLLREAATPGHLAEVKPGEYREITR